MHAIRTGLCALGLIVGVSVYAQTQQTITNVIPASDMRYATVISYTNLYHGGAISIQYTTHAEDPGSWQALYIDPNVADASNTVVSYWDNYAPTGTLAARAYRVVQIPPSDPGVHPSDGMVTITNGSFLMGDALDGSLDAVSHQVTVSAFQISTKEVTYALWRQVYLYATANGYTFDRAGSGKGTNHPVQMINWYDAVKWCNARSQMEGLTPCYYTDAAKTLIYKTGHVDVANANVNWSATGYRLPTEAEWEKAARGGASGHRFPWTVDDNIKGSRANYLGDNAAIRPKYDQGPVGYNGAFIANGMPYTSPVGSFAANDYGLSDMAGNVEEWCWDWYSSSYYKATTGITDPHGPLSSPSVSRVLRGGKWSSGGSLCRCMKRDYQRPTLYNSGAGFRCVRLAP